MVCTLNAVTYVTSCVSTERAGVTTMKMSMDALSDSLFRRQGSPRDRATLMDLVATISESTKLDSTLKGMGFEQSPHEAAIYRRGNGENALLVGVYVDDLVIIGTKDAEVAAFKEEMKATFQMSDLGPLSFYLGIKVHQDDSGIMLRQTAYAKRVVELAGLTDCNPALTPMEERLKLNRDSTTEEVDATQYRCLVGSLRYLAHTRPFLAFSVGYVSRFMQRPTMEHQQVMKRIVRYVAAILDHGLFYPRCPGAAHFVGYSDSDHAGDIDTKAQEVSWIGIARHFSLIRNLRRENSK
ncbi:uncharacterized protein LOC106804336 [Setaria italica]|uniref:uncharacterized protein LOC106804336 n=1 Tax=Setaria italica TaxID=4555 RepID=UPI0007199E13|nr:uncharacterized protein LOC106804336 [Setaria italica]